MKIAHVITGIERAGGGPVESLLGLSAAQVIAGHSLTVITSQARGEKPDTLSEFQKQGVEVRVVAPAFGTVRWVPNLRAKLDAAIRHADIIHIHGIWGFFLYDVASLFHEFSVPYIVRPCGMLHPSCLLRRAFLKRQLRRLRTDKYIHQSALLHFTTERESRYIPSEFENHPHAIVPNGVRVEPRSASSPVDASFWDRYPNLRGKRRIIYLGRIHPIKRIELVVEALSQLSRRDVGFAIVGGSDSEYGTQLDRLVASKGLTNNVVRLGPIYGEEKFAVLRGAEIFVLTSEHENFGVSVAEALACGVPVIVSDQVALSEEVLKARAGRVTGLDSVQICAALRDLLDNNDAYRAAAQNATLLGSRTFDWNPIAAKWSEIYASLVNGMPNKGAVATDANIGAASP